MQFCDPDYAMWIVDIRVLRISTSNTPSPSIEFYRGQTKLKYTAAGLHLSWFQATLDRSWNSDCTMIGSRAYCRFDAGFIEPQCWSRSIPGPFCILYIYISISLYFRISVLIYVVFCIFFFVILYFWIYVFFVLLYFCICCRFYWSKLLGPTGAFRAPRALLHYSKSSASIASALVCDCVCYKKSHLVQESLLLMSKAMRKGGSGWVFDYWVVLYLWWWAWSVKHQVIYLVITGWFYRLYISS